jgi:hypothetical protein
MNEPPRGMSRRIDPDAASTLHEQPGIRPEVMAMLLGLALAAVPSIGVHVLPTQQINDAGAHARPLFALVLVAPLAAAMVAAAASDWLRGRGSLGAAARQLGALALVAASFFVTVLGMAPQDLSTVIGGFLLIGAAVGLGIAFAAGGSADYSDPTLAIVGWVGCALPLVLQVFVAGVTTGTCTPPDPNSRIYYRCPLIGAGSALEMVCGGALLAAIYIGATVVPLGGWLGSRLRGHG